MVLAMLLFAIEDTLLKTATASVPVGQTLMLFGMGGTLGFLLLTWRRGERAFTPQALKATLFTRAFFEILGRLFFLLSLALNTLSSTSAILQATPIAVTLGAAVLFGERVSWQRWVAIMIGFVGVLMIIQPSSEAFQVTSILAILGMIGFAGRDLATRAAPPALSNMQLGVYGFAVLIPTGAFYSLWSGGFVSPDRFSGFMIAAGTLVGIGAYYSLTVAMRTGLVSVVTPFRYSRLLFGLMLGLLVFDESADAMTLAGSAIIVLSGLYILMSNATRKSSAPTRVSERT
ncbi:Riboflavin transporter [Pseudovibrio axinellae]|uniref:Riboflavin transporter n=2 Tax=Pseudovibrio axinellae TaxID=989403 RepID=A0A165Z8N0_9HYPH|nr:Riboflavin transporter [Pseudovibrio axinellae]SEQ33881.1 EamA-like transporter family protein [Pseudovibrio axinellae]